MKLLPLPPRLPQFAAAGRGFLISSPPLPVRAEPVEALFFYFLFYFQEEARTAPFGCLPRHALRTVFDKLRANGSGLKPTVPGGASSAQRCRHLAAQAARTVPISSRGSRRSGAPVTRHCRFMVAKPSLRRRKIGKKPPMLSTFSTSPPNPARESTPRR